MAFTKLASACPAPQGATALVALAAGPVVSPTMTTADEMGLITKFIELAARIDAFCRAGGQQVYGVVAGLGLTAGAALTLNVAAGQANIGGTVEPTLPTATMFDNTTNMVWLKQDKTFYVGNNTVAPPAGAACFLGFVVAAGGVITSVDYSGVVYLVGGIAWRTTADKFKPSDTPGYTFTLNTITLAGTWTWNGAEYLQVPSLTKQNARSFETHFAAVATVTLTAYSATVQRLTSVAQQKILLAPNADITFAHYHEIFNDNASGSGINWLLRDSADSSTISTIQPQQVALVRPIVSSGAPIWPTAVGAVIND